MHSKKTVLAVGFLILTLAGAAIAETAAPASAPAPGAAAPRAHAFRHARRAVVAERLGLTDAQKAKLKELHGQTATAIQGVRANASLTAEQQQTQIKALRDAAREQFRAVLTDDQRAKLAELRSHPRMLNALATRRMGMAMIARRLELTPEQRTSMRDIQARTVAALKPIRADSSLTPEARRAKVREVMQARNNQIRGLLTPEQQDKLEHIRHRLLRPLGPLG